MKKKNVHKRREMPYDVQFTSKSEGGNSHTITEWLWTFGDGTISIEQHPCHSYDKAGEYTVALNVTNDCGRSDISQQQIQEGDAKMAIGSPTWSNGESHVTHDEPYWSDGESGHYLEAPAAAKKGSVSSNLAVMRLLLE